jgi:hypothetical protein
MKRLRKFQSIPPVNVKIIFVLASFVIAIAKVNYVHKNVNAKIVQISRRNNKIKYTLIQLIVNIFVSHLADCFN